MESGVVSKTQAKKARKRAAWLASQPERDLLRKQRRAQRPPKPVSPPKPPILFKSDKAEWLQRRSAAPRLIIDCEFEQELTEKERGSLKRQLMYCYSIVKKSDQPWFLTLCGVSDRLRSDIEHISAGQWAVDIRSEPYIDCFPSGDLVYLTADSGVELAAFQQTSAYIVGGLVDHNRLKRATLEKASAQGIRTAKLPLGNLFKIETSKVLTINHVVQILSCYRETHDWVSSIESTLPARKHAVALPQSPSSPTL